MSWDPARRWLAIPRFGRAREADEPSEHPELLPDAQPVLARAASLCIASGKGGTGKSVVSASVGTLLAEHGRTLIVDADMGIGNAHILQGVSPERSFVEVVAGGVSVLEIVTPCRAGLDLLAAGSGVPHMAGLSAAEVQRIAEGIELLELGYAHLIVDSAAGVSEQTMAFAACCDLVLVITTPDVTAMTDAYAFLKVLLRARPEARPLLVVNRARDLTQAEAVAARMETVARKFLARAPRWIGWVPEDPAVSEAVNGRAPVVLQSPGSPAARALSALSTSLRVELSRARRLGLGRSLREGGRGAGAERAPVNGASGDPPGWS